MTRANQPLKVIALNFTTTDAANINHSRVDIHNLYTTLNIPGHQYRMNTNIYCLENEGR